MTENLDRRLQDELRAGVERGVERRDSDLRSATRRGRFLRFRRRAGWTGMTAVVVLTAVLVGASLRSPFTTRARDPLGATSDKSSAALRNPSQHSAGETTGDSVARVATFAVRAVAQAGLLEPYGRFYDYKAVDRADSGWNVAFVAGECFRTVQVETCNRIAQGDPPQLHVEKVADHFAITKATGPMTADQMAKLLAYTEEANSEPDHWEFLVVQVKDSLVDKNSTDVKATALWTGPVPSNDAAEACILRAYNESGDLVTSESLPARTPPTMEDERAGSFVGTSISSDLHAKRASIDCS